LSINICDGMEDNLAWHFDPRGQFGEVCLQAWSYAEIGVRVGRRQALAPLPLPVQLSIGIIFVSLMFQPRSRCLCGALLITVL
jgi:hypothetical protein